MKMIVKKPTHKSKKTGKKVFVERIEGNLIVVRSMKGKVLGAYEKKDMSRFNDRYE